MTKLYRYQISYAKGTSTVVLNPNECGICHRRRWQCDTYPWPNHTFIAANAAGDLVPPRWRNLELVDGYPPETLL